MIVLIPALGAAAYLWGRAADQYASRLAFSVRTENQGSAIELLGGISQISGSNSSDADILFSYLNSQELVSKVHNRVNLERIWSKVDKAQDPVFAYNPSGTIEDLQHHWTRKIAIVYDSGTGLVDVKVLAFDPRDALMIAKAILLESTTMINGLSKTAQLDSIRFTQEELEGAVDRLKTARRALTQFRNRTQIVDPSIDTQNQMGLLVTLQQQLADALIESDLLADTTRANERRKLGLGEEGDSSGAFATLVGEYEGLIVDREFAETAYTATLAAHDAALSDARRQSRYLAAHVKPTLAERAEYPARAWMLTLVTVFCFFGWAILSLVYYSIRDRR
jgi:capsular polysaccharide transport system permease protein